MRRKRTVGVAAATVLSFGLVVACRDFSDGPSASRAGASGAVNGGQLPDLTEGGEPSLGASAGEANTAGQSSVAVAAGMGGVALPEIRDGGAGGAAGAAVAPPEE